jgi:hypothetical protein
MTDRRRAPRYTLGRTTRAEINLLQDVSLQSAAGDDLVVLASKFPDTNGRLLIEIVQANGEIASLDAEILSSAPVLEAGNVRFRLELRVAGFAGLFCLTPVFG